MLAGRDTPRSITIMTAGEYRVFKRTLTSLICEVVIMVL